MAQFINKNLIHLSNSYKNGLRGSMLEGSSRCFSKEQLIATESGNKKISEITTGEIVKTHNEKTGRDEFKKVKEVLKFKNTKKSVRVKLKNGFIIESTEDHKFYYKGNWCSLKHLLSLNEFIIDLIESYEYIELDEVYDLSIEDNHNYYLDSGVLAHNSGKTIAGIDFIIRLAAFEETKFTLNIIRQTQASFKTTLYDDLGSRLSAFGQYNPFAGKKEINMFWVMDNKINLLGADNPSKFEGATCDFAFFNELLDIDQVIFDQQEQRCRKFLWGDWNPKVTQHWVFDKILRRPDISYCHSTYKDNPFISDFEKKKIESYEPTPVNIQNGTADDYRWSVYGLGKRGVPEGLVFKNVTWIDEFPEDVDNVIYGMDFGFTNSPSALVRAATNGINLYAEKLIYIPTENADVLAELLEPTLGFDNHCWADCADKYGDNVAMISDLRRKGFKVFGAKKWNGSIIYGIDLIKRYKLHLVRDVDVKIEQENYRWRMINGIKLNSPIDGFDHFFSALRYTCQHELRV